MRLIMSYVLNFVYFVIWNFSIWFADINECVVSNDCHSKADCKNTYGSYICSCRHGYVGDGKICTRECRLLEIHINYNNVEKDVFLLRNWFQVWGTMFCKDFCEILSLDCELIHNKNWNNYNDQLLLPKVCF